MPKLLEIATEYAHLKCVEPKPVMIAMAKLIQICGDKDIQDYDRKDARTFVDQYGKVKTTAIRRRLNSINAVFNWATFVPSDASFLATAAPISRPAPVTITVFPASFMISAPTSI